MAMDVLKLFSWDKTREAVAELQNLLKCSVCQEIATDPQCLGCCDNFFCLVCVKKLDGKCPKCKVTGLPPCDTRPDRIIRDLVDASNDIKVLLGIDGGQQSVEPDLQPYSTPKKQLRPSVLPRDCVKISTLGTSNTPLRNASSARAAVVSSTGLSRTGTPSSKTKVQGNRGAPKISVGKNMKSTPKGTNVRKKPVAKASVTPMKSGLKKSVGSARKPPIPVTPESNKLGKMGHLGSKGMSPGTPAVKKRNSKGETPLHVACIKGDREKVLQLLAEGANPNTKDNAGWTPLHEVCSHGYKDIAEVLLHHGAMVDVPGGSHENALHDAVTQGQVELVKLLRAWGASDTARNLYGHTPRSLAAKCGGASELLAALDTPRDTSLQQPTILTSVPDKVVLMGSSLSPAQTKKLDQLARVLRARLVADYSNEVTHIIVDCSEDRIVLKQTFTYMMGLVSGKWILPYAWVEECLTAGKLAHEEKFEVRGSSSSTSTSSPAASRINTQSLRPGLFSGCHMFLWGNCSRPQLSKKEVESLVRGGGGVVLAREPNPESIPDSESTVPYHVPPDSPIAHCSHFIIYAEGNAEPELKYNMAHVKSLPLSWLLASIDNFSLQPSSKAGGENTAAN